jgi:glycosyltransferase involved in cell wall biosynthesis
MRIGIDYTAAVRQGAGIGRYTRNLVQALLALDAENDYVLLSATGGLGAEPGVAEWATSVPWQTAATTRRKVRAVNLPVSDRLLAVLWHRLRLPLWAELACGRLDVFHSPDFTLPPLRAARAVLTVHDLSFIRVPDSAASRLRAYLLQAVPRSVRRADVILADSQSTRSDVIELLRVDPGRVEVLYPGVEERFQPVPKDALAAVRRRYCLPERFVLSLGTLQPRKNYERLIEAFALLRHEARTEAKLVIVGGLGWMYEGIARRVAELELSDEVLFPGYVSDEDLPALYSLADLFAFPSLYEGFGLPALEAMACGTPVVASNVSSLPEVVGDAALTVDPLDVSALAEAMSRSLNDAGLRQEMVGRGLARARQFRWPDSAAQLLEVYRRLG